MFTFFRKDYPFFLLLVTIIFISYSNFLPNKFVSDDLGWVGGNWSTISKGFFYDPMGLLRASTLFILHFLCLDQAFCVRLPNLFMHLGNCILLFAILNQITKKQVAYFASIIFAAHPMLSEAVGWISGGVYVQYTFFFLLSFLFYILSNKKPNKKSYLILSLIFILIAYFTSRRIFSLPIFFLYEFFYGDLRQNWKKLIPFGLLLLLWVPLQLIRVDKQISDITNGGAIENKKVPYLIQIPLSITTYLNVFVFPKGLTFYHSEVFIGFTEAIVRWIAFMIVLISGFFLFRKKKILIFSSLFFFSTILIYNNPFGTNWVIAERYVYLPTIGLCIIAGYYLNQLLQKNKLKYLTLILFSLIIFLFGIRIFIRGFDWRNQVTLLAAVGDVVPDDPRALNTKGTLFYKQGKLEEAKQIYEKAIQVAPEYFDSYFNLGNFYKDNDQIELAETYYLKAYTLKPNQVPNLQNLSIISFRLGKVDRSLDYLNQAIVLEPSNSDLYSNLGVIYLNLGRKKEAGIAFQKAINLDPKNSDAKVGLKKSTE